MEELVNKVATPVKMDMVAQEENHPGYQHHLVIKEDLVVAVALVLDLLVLLVVLAALEAVAEDTKIIANLILMEQTVWVVAPVVVKKVVYHQVLVDLVVLLLLILSDHSFHRQY